MMEDLGRDNSFWIDTPAMRMLVRDKYTLAILIYLHTKGVASTREIIRQMRGRPSTIIKILRDLAKKKIVSRVRKVNGRHEVQTRLTLRGLQLVETAPCRWKRLIRKW